MSAFEEYYSRLRGLKSGKHLFGSDDFISVLKEKFNCTDGKALEKAADIDMGMRLSREEIRRAANWYKEGYTVSQIVMDLLNGRIAGLSDEKQRETLLLMLRNMSSLQELPENAVQEKWDEQDTDKLKIVLGAMMTDNLKRLIESLQGVTLEKTTELSNEEKEDRYAAAGAAVMSDDELGICPQMGGAAIELAGQQSILKQDNIDLIAGEIVILGFDLLAMEALGILIGVCGDIFIDYGLKEITFAVIAKVFKATVSLYSKWLMAAGIIIGVGVVISGINWLYNKLTERKNEALLTNEVRTNTVIESEFSDEVQEEEESMETDVEISEEMDEENSEDLLLE